MRAANESILSYHPQIIKTEDRQMKSLLGSRKFIVAVVSLAAMVLGTASGIEVTPEQTEVMVQLVCAWLIAQGIADNGAGGSTRAG
jgi:hypothetical protein